MSYGYRNYNNQVSQKPENVLIRAEELIASATSRHATKEKREALRLIHDFISNPKNKRNWNKVYEPMMRRHLQLCVELKDARYAKDGLHQYRAMCMQSDPMLLSDVIVHLMTMSEAQCTEAKAKADKAAVDSADAVHDLELEETPESIMLSSMSSDFAKERTDRDVVVPWLKFLWEIYRAILELLWKNQKLEKTYHKAAERAFNFCSTYKRNLEFRRLCEMLRNQLALIQKGQGTIRQGVKQEWTAESREMHLITRFKQLEVATDLELWNEGFRAVEDIYAVNQVVKRSTKVLMITYYEKLTRIFWVSDNALFHAYAAFKHYMLSVESNRDLTEAERQTLATSTVVASLCLPPTPKQSPNTASQDEVEQEKNSRMATLLDFQVNPSREALISAIKAAGLLSHVTPEMQGLFDLVENKFSPFSFMEDVMPFVDKFEANEALAKYGPVFKRRCVIKLVDQLSTVYSRVKIDFVKKLLAPTGINYCVVEHYLVTAVAKNQLQMRVDHANGFINFGTLAAATLSMETQVAKFGKALQDIANKIRMTSDAGAKKASDDRAAYLHLVSRYAENVHDASLERKAVIERRKEDLEERKADRLEQEMIRRKAEEVERAKNELERIKNEEANRENEKRRKVQADQQAEQIVQMLEKSGKSIDLAAVKVADKDSRDKMIAEARDNIQKGKDDEVRKKTDQAKRLDFLTRALRLEGAPKVVAMYEGQVAEDKELYDLKMAEDEKKDREKHAQMVREKERVQKMQPFRAQFEADLYHAQKAAYDAEVARQRALAVKEHYLKKLADARKRKEAHDLRVQKEIDAEVARLKKEEEENITAERAANLRRQQIIKEEQDREADAARQAERSRAEQIRREEADREDRSRSGGEGSRFGGEGSRFGASRGDSQADTHSSWSRSPAPARSTGDSGGGGSQTGARGGGDRDSRFANKFSSANGDKPRFGGGESRSGSGRDSGDRGGSSWGDRGGDGGDSRFANKFGSGTSGGDSRFANKFGNSRDRDSRDADAPKPRSSRGNAPW